MGADKKSSRRRWRLQEDYPSWLSPRNHWSATEPRNQLPTLQTRERSRTQNSSPLTYTGQAGEHHRSDRCLLVKTGDFHRNSSTPVGPVQNTGQTGLSQKAPKRQTDLPSSKLNQTRNNSNTEQQRTHPNVHQSKNPMTVAPVRMVRGTGQTGVTWASRDEQHPRVNTLKSKPRSPESLHGLEQDIGDSRDTSWGVHSQDYVHQNLPNQEESKKSRQEHL
jgi:hypothetical protein